MESKYNIDDMKRLAANHGGQCLSKAYKNNLKWRCSENHRWKATAAHIIKGTWCARCKGMVVTIADMYALAKSRGFRCISQEYINGHYRLEWKCKKGHVWSARPANLKKGNGCPICAGYNKSIRDMKFVAKRRSGDCLSRKYTDKNTKLKWRCHAGHEWMATPDNVINRASWCPYCSGRHKNIKDMQVLAQRKNGKCLSVAYISAKTHLEWKCFYGHIWRATPSNIKKGRWCPTCAHGARFETRKRNRMRT